MATTYYVNGTTGDDLDDGLTPGTAKQTILGARNALTGGDLVVIDPGVYPELDSSWTTAARDGAMYMANPLKPGNVIVDFQNVEHPNHWYFDNEEPVFLGLHFRNPGILSTSHLVVGRTTTKAKFLHCVFYNQFGTQQGRAVNGSGSFSPQFHFQNCLFYNFDEGLYANYQPTLNYNNYIVNCTTPVVGAVNYNAFVGGTGTNINTASVDPGLRDPANLDFRLDPTTVPADYQAFMTGGQQGDRIGPMAMGGFFYHPAYPQLRFLTPDPLPAAGNPQPSWENEGPAGSSSYTDGTPGNIIEDAITGALKIDLATTPGATGGRVRSGVIDMGVDGSKEFVSAAIRAFNDGPLGAMIDTNTTLPQEFEYRTSNTVFLAGDGAPAWSTVYNDDTLANTDRYLQLRITFRTDHTNA
jgi:hypothetical protein